LIKFRNQGTSLGRAIVGLVLIGLGTITLWLLDFTTMVNSGDGEVRRFIFVFHTVVGYIILISSLFCNKKKDE
jgi:heme/copper-type cytochrome/quinol oxidase subunit 4